MNWCCITFLLNFDWIFFIYIISYKLILLTFNAFIFVFTFFKLCFTTFVCFNILSTPVKCLSTFFSVSACMTGCIGFQVAGKFQWIDLKCLTPFPNCSPNMMCGLASSTDSMHLYLKSLWFPKYVAVYLFCRGCINLFFPVNTVVFIFFYLI